MRRRFARLAALALPAALLSGCSGAVEKADSLVSVYGITVLLSLLMLIGCCFVIKKKNPWFLLLFASVFVVNAGYLALAVSGDLQAALFANRVAYLGSVFLPLSMWMIILKVTRIRLCKWLPGLLLGVAVIIFLIAASPGYLNIYYQDVSFHKLNGVTVLHKVYGPLHWLYMVYLLGYFAVMIGAILYASVRNKLDSPGYAVIIAIAVFVNIIVWLIEQLVQIDFEILSVSYIISESFLLGLHLFIADTERQKAQLLKQMRQEIPSPGATVSEAPAPSQAEQAQLELFASGVARLTPKEQALYECYIAGMPTNEILEQLSIKENTLKFHSKNLYGKLGVSSRKQLVGLHRILSEK